MIFMIFTFFYFLVAFIRDQRCGVVECELVENNKRRWEVFVISHKDETTCDKRWKEEKNHGGERKDFRLNENVQLFS